MDNVTVETLLAEALEGRLLLTHPFYRRWDEGALTGGELAGYAAQYRHFEAMLPGFLQTVAASLPPGPARGAVEGNLADEEGDPIPHLELFDAFAAAVDAQPTSPGMATEALMGTYQKLAAEGPGSALAGLLAYEAQAPSVAASKAEGLRRHFGLDAGSTRFWDHHATVDTDHAAWTVGALVDLGTPAETFSPAARLVADAWWALLDERQAQAPAAA